VFPTNSLTDDRVPPPNIITADEPTLKPEVPDEPEEPELPLVPEEPL
jgi:hypothetical protein